MLSELKTCFLEAYDDNKDGKIDIREVSHFGYHEAMAGYNHQRNFKVQMLPKLSKFSLKYHIK